MNTAFVGGSTSLLSSFQLGRSFNPASKHSSMLEHSSSLEQMTLCHMCLIRPQFMMELMHMAFLKHVSMLLVLKQQS